MPRFVVIPAQAYDFPEFHSDDEAIKKAKERICKNQRCYGGERIHKRYAVCEVRYYVGPVEPVVKIEIIDATD